jgi:hypothetical protein
LTLLHVGAEIRRVLEAAKLLGAFEVYADEASAVASFRT